MENLFLKIFSFYFDGKYTIYNIFRLANMKEQILHTALKQFLQFGIRDMSIQRLVETMSISTKTFYKFFKNKEQLLEEALHLFYQQQQEMWRQRSAGQNTITLFFDIWRWGADNEFRVNKVLYQDLNHYYPKLKEKIESAEGETFITQFTQIIQKGMDEGVFEASILPKVILSSITVLYLAAVRGAQFERFHVSHFDLMLNTVAVYIRGFSTQKGIEELEQHLQAIQATNRKKVAKRSSKKAVLSM
jgi:AcrR family transcriptional regulator